MDAHDDEQQQAHQARQAQPAPWPETAQRDLSGTWPEHARDCFMLDATMSRARWIRLGDDVCLFTEPLDRTLEGYEAARARKPWHDAYYRMAAFPAERLYTMDELCGNFWLWSEVLHASLLRLLVADEYFNDAPHAPVVHVQPDPDKMAIECAAHLDAHDAGAFKPNLTCTPVPACRDVAAKKPMRKHMWMAPVFEPLPSPGVSESTLSCFSSVASTSAEYVSDSDDENITSIRWQRGYVKERMEKALRNVRVNLQPKGRLRLTKFGSVITAESLLSFVRKE